jgi:hypothetical protein
VLALEQTYRPKTFAEVSVEILIPEKVFQFMQIYLLELNETWVIMLDRGSRYDSMRRSITAHSLRWSKDSP